VLAGTESLSEIVIFSTFNIKIKNLSLLKKNSLFSDHVTQKKCSLTIFDNHKELSNKILMNTVTLARNCMQKGM
jgi:hypothetical protein